MHDFKCLMPAIEFSNKQFPPCVTHARIYDCVTYARIYEVAEGANYSVKERSSCRDSSSNRRVLCLACSESNLSWLAFCILLLVCPLQHLHQEVTVHPNYIFVFKPLSFTHSGPSSSEYRASFCPMIEAPIGILSCVLSSCAPRLSTSEGYAIYPIFQPIIP
jgi:hypothetical protein